MTEAQQEQSSLKIPSFLDWFGCQGGEFLGILPRLSKILQTFFAFLPTTKNQIKMKFKVTNPKPRAYLSLHILMKSHFFQSFKKCIFLRGNDFPTSCLFLQKKLKNLF